MSSVKEYMHELWSQVDAEVTFTCPHCRNPVSKWLKIAGDDPEQFEEVACEFDEDEDAWTVIIRHDENGWSAELEEDPDVDVTINVDDSYEDWYESEPEPGAYGIFCDAMGDWKRNLLELSTPGGASSRNRMLFGTLYSIAEAYFSDAIIGMAEIDTNLQRQMLKLKSLKDRRVTLTTVLQKPTIVRDMVKTALQALSFHDLKQVNWISEKAFKKSILPRDQEDRKLILMSVGKRHDCIHRNGRDKDGNQHDDITSDYLKKVGAIFESMAETLEEAIRDAKAKIYFQDLHPKTPER